MAQDSHEPGSLGGFAAKTVLCFDRRQERVLHEVFGHARIAHLADGEVEKVIRVGVHPIAAENRLALNARHQIGFVVHRDCPYCNGCATKRLTNVNSRNRL